MSATELWDEARRLHELASNEAGRLAHAARELDNQLSAVPAGPGDVYQLAEISMALLEAIARTTATVAHLIGQVEGLAEATVRVGDNIREATHVDVDTGEAVCGLHAVKRQSASRKAGTRMPEYGAQPLGAKPPPCPACEQEAE